MTTNRRIWRWAVAAAYAAAATVWAAEGPATFKVSGLTFQRPAGWEWIKTASSMRAAQLSVPQEGKEAGEVVFFYFGPGNGGGTQANVDRWLGQFEEPKDKLQSKVESKTVGGHKVTYVQAEGTFLSGSPVGPKTPKKGFMLMGAILEQDQGNVFVKFTAPAEVAKPAADTFRTMVESALK